VFVFHTKTQKGPLTKLAKKNVKRGGPSAYRTFRSRIFQQIAVQSYQGFSPTTFGKITKFGPPSHFVDRPPLHIFYKKVQFLCSFCKNVRGAPVSIKPPICDKTCVNKTLNLCQYCDNAKTGLVTLDRSKQAMYNIREPRQTSFKDHETSQTV